MHRVSANGKPQQRVVCHVLQSAEAEMMSSALGQSFQLAFQIFLHQNGIPPPANSEATQEMAEMYHDDLIHYSKVRFRILINRLNPFGESRRAYTQRKNVYNSLLGSDNNTSQTVICNTSKVDHYNTHRPSKKKNKTSEEATSIFKNLLTFNF